MFKLFRSSALGEPASHSSTLRAITNELAPDTVPIDEAPSFPLAAHLTRVNGLPALGQALE
jgi:hypothetical protein